MGDYSLTPKERSTLYGLVRYPNLNDRELSDRLDIKLSTVTAIRRRLFRDGVLETRRLPMTHRLEDELLLVEYGEFNQGVPFDRSREVFSGTAAGIGDMIYSFITPSKWLFMLIARNYTSIKRSTDGLSETLNREHVAEMPRSCLIFPFQVTSLLNYFDYSPVIRHVFDIEDEEEDPGRLPLVEYENCETVHLSQKESGVLKTLVEYPDMPDNAIADRASVSRQAVSNMKKRFEESGLLRTVRTVDLTRIGCEITGLVHTKFNPRTPIEERLEGIRYVLEKVPIFFFALGNYESLLLGALKSFNDVDEIRTDVLGFYKRQDYITEEPSIELFSLANMEWAVNHRFDRVIDRML